MCDMSTTSVQQKHTIMAASVHSFVLTMILIQNQTLFWISHYIRIINLFHDGIGPYPKPQQIWKGRQQSIDSPYFGHPNFRFIQATQTTQISGRTQNLFPNDASLRKTLIGRIGPKYQQQSQSRYHERMGLGWDTHALCDTCIPMQFAPRKQL